MLHLNGNLLCAIDTETTGLDPAKHEIVQICILPLDVNLNPSRTIRPFYMNIKPECPEAADSEAMSVNKLAALMERGMDKWKAADLLGEWFNRLNLALNKKITPLGHNWSFDAAFIREWLGPESYKLYFDYHFRDTCAVANFVNDRCYFMNEPFPFSRQRLSNLCDLLGIKYEHGHDALGDCILTAKVYQRMMGMFIPSLPRGAEMVVPTVPDIHVEPNQCVTDDSGNAQDSLPESKDTPQT